MAMRKVKGSDILLVLNLVLLCIFTDAGKIEDLVQESSGGLPFLQFTNGGIRLNFAGYHAEAGLGGILGDTRTGGGLHASAGTPFGPQASAGLGGLLSGDNANTGGGLYAQAGLGNNQPTAKAGLEGALDGNTNIPTSSNNIPSNPPTEHTHIQIISKSATKGHKNQRAIATKSIIMNEPVPESKYSFVKLYGVNTGDIGGKSTIENVKKIPVVPPVNDLVSAKEVETGTNVDTTIGNNFNVNHPTQEPPIINRWYLRKKLRAGPFSKKVIHTSSVIPVSDPIPAPALESSSATAPGAVSAKSSGKIISQVNVDSSADNVVSYVGSKTYKSGSLFDDIFNIPISTLMAVNQLLKNNAG